MLKVRFQMCRSHGFALVFGSIFSLLNVFTVFAESSNPKTSVENDEETFIFMGRCPNGVMYRLKAYQKMLDGAAHFFYDYEGPAGQGTIESETPPKTLAIRVCLPLAEIRSDR